MNWEDILKVQVASTKQGFKTSSKKLPTHDEDTPCKDKLIRFLKYFLLNMDIIDKDIQDALESLKGLHERLHEKFEWDIHTGIHTLDITDGYGYTKTQVDLDGSNFFWWTIEVAPNALEWIESLSEEKCCSILNKQTTDIMLSSGNLEGYGLFVGLFFDEGDSERYKGDAGIQMGFKYQRGTDAPYRWFFGVTQQIEKYCLEILQSHFNKAMGN